MKKEGILGSSSLNNGNEIYNNLSNSLLSAEQIALIHLYTIESPFYRELNHAMREGTEEQRKKFDHFIYYLNETLKLLSPHQGSVYRGIDCINNNYQPGKKIVWPSFSSASKDPNVALDFIGKTNKGSLFMIKSKRAVPIRQYSAMPNEEECLFCANSQFEIASIISDASKKVLEASMKIDLSQVVIYDLTEI